VGITPLRALFETLPAGPGDVILLYRATDEKELVFREELDKLARKRRIEVHYLLGRRDARPNPLHPRRIAELVSDVSHRDVFLCGPPAMMDVASQSLRALGVRRSQIHRERFEL
jgi:ferredoxin-NADP reductase